MVHNTPDLTIVKGKKDKKLWIMDTAIPRGSRILKSDLQDFQEKNNSTKQGKQETNSQTEIWASYATMKFR